ncbi:hypothetical protein [Bradyrhizobium ottawaense]|uniref:Uncharacterized protein n=1 Tax=Bradyrhizobium ottawaense TaxID=931866 RepID=A0ABY0QH10_9BRAD|nr:hypothetical protein [Bradyrhizobium ottawaense]SDK39124.1 hypothetical protein SAMN05444163_8002 [Bradyrhizobium ottawaense]
MVACISDSLYCEAAACEKHLPDIKDTWRRAGAALKSHDRRPTPYDIEVYSFPQGWGSTALGFGGIGGQAMTSAQTTVVMCSPSAAVYFGRRLAYVIKTVNGKFMADLASHAMSDVRRHSQYEAI